MAIAIAAARLQCRHFSMTYSAFRVKVLELCYTSNSLLEYSAFATRSSQITLRTCYYYYSWFGHSPVHSSFAQPFSSTYCCQFDHFAVFTTLPVNPTPLDYSWTPHSFCQLNFIDTNSTHLNFPLTKCPVNILHHPKLLGYSKSNPWLTSTLRSFQFTISHAENIWFLRATA